ncbi:MAG: hydroxyethylthiazole kinase [Tissierellia bacterium]|nr:hydroxyethylthiazole kinase [Tissierellia bacterium]
MEELKKEIRKAVEDVRRTNPMAPSITNTVTINFVANTQLAVGGSAAMIYLPDEADAMARMAKSFYINVGTMFPIYEETFSQLAKTLKETSIPWVLDPVAVGIGQLREASLLKFKEAPPKIIRGNASEIIALCGLWGLEGGGEGSNVRGVDAQDQVEEAKEAAISLAKFTGGAVAVSGPVDLVTDGKRVARSYGGSHYLEKITGAGCSLGGVCAVYATCASPFVAALTATAIYNLAGKRAEERVEGPGSFQVEFINALYTASPEDVSNNKLEVEVLL